MAGSYLAISSMTSAMTRNQVVSFIISVALCLILVLIGIPQVTTFLHNVLGFGPNVVDMIASFSFMTHFEGFQKGVLDSRDLIFFLSVILFSLFTTGVIIREHRAG
jgi:ABC-2 type transport system permease protein